MANFILCRYKFHFHWTFPGRRKTYKGRPCLEVSAHYSVAVWVCLRVQHQPASFSLGNVLGWQGVWFGFGGDENGSIGFSCILGCCIFFTHPTEWKQHPRRGLTVGERTVRLMINVFKRFSIKITNLEQHEKRAHKHFDCSNYYHLFIL